MTSPEAPPGIDPEQLASRLATPPGLSAAATVSLLAERSARELSRSPVLAQAIAEEARRRSRGRDLRPRAQAAQALAKVLLVRGRVRRALPLLLTARRGYRRLGDRRCEAAVELALIAASALLGDRGGARRAARAARRLYRGLRDPVGLAKVESNLGSLEQRWDRPRAALAAYRHSLALFDQAGLPFEGAAVALNLANVLSLVGELDEAERHYERARTAFLAEDRQAQAAQVDYNLAYLQFLRGHYDSALRLHAKALAVFRHGGDETHVGLVHLDRAELLLELGLLPEAEREAHRAHRTFQVLGLRYEAAKAAGFGALARGARGLRTGLVERLQAASGEFRSLGNRAWAATLDLERARVLGEGDDPQAARSIAARASRVLDELGLPDRAARAVTVLARAESARGRHREALRALDRACGPARRSSPRSQAGLRLARGRSLYRLGRLRRALAELDRGIQLIEQLHRDAPSGRTEEVLARERKELFREALQVCLDLADRGVPDAVDRAFLYAERARSRSLVDRELGQACVDLDRSVRADLDRLTRLRHQAWCRRRAAEGERRPGPTLGKQLLREAGALEREAGALEERLARADPRLLAPGAALPPAPPEIIRELPPGSALIEYAVTETATVLFVLDHEGLRMERLAADRSSVLRSLRGLQFHMNRVSRGPEDPRRAPSSLADAAHRHLGELGEALLDPVPDRTAASTLILAPHDILHYVPFHALRTRGRILLEDHEVSEVPSATALVRCLRRPPRPEARGSLILAVPSSHTPGVEREARGVAALLPEPCLLVGREATSEKLRRLAGSRRFVHLSTHGRYRSDSPLASSLAMADGWLTFRDIQGLELTADLVVLAACHAGLDRLLSGDELLGLGRSLLQAGAASVITTLWAAEDGAMVEWMCDFYTAVLASGRTAAAFRHATLGARERYPHPYLWAPSVLSGRPWLDAAAPA